MVFITAGMGGGTGTGAAPIIADLAREAGILTVGVVTKPFKFEGANRMRQAEAGVAALSAKVDSLVIIPNDRLKYVTDQKITFANAFGIADDVLKQAVTSISELVGYSDRVIINLDFADVSAIMRNAGRAHMGVGVASGKDKAEQAGSGSCLQPVAGNLHQRCHRRADQCDRCDGSGTRRCGNRCQYRDGSSQSGCKYHLWCGIL